MYSSIYTFMLFGNNCQTDSSMNMLIHIRFMISLGIFTGLLFLHSVLIQTYKRHDALNEHLWNMYQWVKFETLHLNNKVNSWNKILNTSNIPNSTTSHDRTFSTMTSTSSIPRSIPWTSKLAYICLLCIYNKKKQEHNLSVMVFHTIHEFEPLE